MKVISPLSLETDRVGFGHKLIMEAAPCASEKRYSLPEFATHDRGAGMKIEKYDRGTQEYFCKHHLAIEMEETVRLRAALLAQLADTVLQ